MPQQQQAGQYTAADVQASPQNIGAYTAADIDQAKVNQPKSTWWDSVSDFSKALWNQVNPVSGLKGAAQLTSSPVESLKTDANARKQIYSSAEDAFKKGNYVEGAAHLLYGSLPFIGPQLDQAGQQFMQGQVAKPLGTSVGMGLNMAVPLAIPDQVNLHLPTGELPERMYQSALKPSLAKGAPNPAGLVETGLEQGIPVSKAGVSKLSNLMDDVNKQIADTVASAPNTPINKYAVTSRLGSTVQKFATQVNPEADVNAIGESGNEFLRNQPVDIPASEAQALKQGTYQQLRGKYGQLSAASIEAQKSLARGLKEELANAFPELSDLNATDSKLINLDGALERAVNRQSNHQLGGIGTPLAAAGTKALTGSTGAAAVMGGMKAILDNPIIKSKIAIALNRASKGGITIPVATARYDAYVNALGNASQNGGQENQ